MSKTVISIKYEGQYSGYLSMEETDGKGVLHLDSTLPDAPSTDTDNCKLQITNDTSSKSAMHIIPCHEVDIVLCLLQTALTWNLLARGVRPWAKILSNSDSEVMHTTQSISLAME